MKVLVIDDNPVDVKLLSTVLGAAGYDVTGAPAAAAALAAIRREKPQVVLVDLALPGMDGMALVRQLKADPETRGIVVAAVTGHPSWWKKDEALDGGDQVGPALGRDDGVDLVDDHDTQIPEQLGDRHPGG